MKQEPYMGQNDDAKKKVRKFPNRHKMSILNPQGECSQRIPILQNGYEYNLKSLFINYFGCCGFDALFHTISAIFVDSDKCKAIINAAIDTFSTIIKDCIQSGIKKDVYIKRGEFLRKCYSEYCNENDEKVNKEIAEASNREEIKQLEKKRFGTFIFKSKIRTFCRSVVMFR